MVLALPASAFADATVNVGDVSYDPPAVKLKAGTTVTWHWLSAVPRSVTSDAGDPEPFDSGSKTALDPDFQHTFNTAGVYRYHDSGDPTQTGSPTSHREPRPPPPP